MAEPADPLPVDALPEEAARAIARSFEVKTYDIDFAGIVSNIVFVRWLEDLRLALMGEAYPLSQALADGVAPLLLETRIEYRRPVTIQDRPEGRMWVRSMGRLRWRHSLEAWGERLGITKIGAEIDDFSCWTPELQARCVGDVQLIKMLYHFLQPDGLPAGVLALEHRVAAICGAITVHLRAALPALARSATVVEKGPRRVSGGLFLCPFPVLCPLLRRETPFTEFSFDVW